VGLDLCALSSSRARSLNIISPTCLDVSPVNIESLESCSRAPALCCALLRRQPRVCAILTQTPVLHCAFRATRRNRGHGTVALWLAAASDTRRAMASAAAGVAAAIAGAGTGPTPPMFVSLRGKESLAVELHDPTTGTFGTAVADLGEVLEFQYSSDGSTMAVLKKDRVLLFKLVPGTGVPELLSELPEDNVTALAFSPLGSRLLTLRKRKPGEEARESLRAIRSSCKRRSVAAVAAYNTRL